SRIGVSFNSSVREQGVAQGMAVGAAYVRKGKNRLFVYFGSNLKQIAVIGQQLVIEFGIKALQQCAGGAPVFTVHLYFGQQRNGGSLRGTTLFDGFRELRNGV